MEGNKEAFDGTFMHVIWAGTTTTETDSRSPPARTAQLPVEQGKLLPPIPPGRKRTEFLPLPSGPPPWPVWRRPSPSRAVWLRWARLRNQKFPPHHLWPRPLKNGWRPKSLCRGSSTLDQVTPLGACTHTWDELNCVIFWCTRAYTHTCVCMYVHNDPHSNTHTQ